MKYLDSSSNTYKEIYAKPSGDTLPIGSQVPFSSLTIPDNWLLCDGRAISRANYSELFAVIGTTYGAGDGSTTFNIPNKKGRTSVGFDSSQTEFNAVGSSGGEKTHTLSVAELAEHRHDGLSWLGDDVSQSITLNGGSDSGYNLPYSGGNAGHHTDIQTYKAGGSQAHNNLQPYQTDVWIIKAKQSAGVVATVVDTLDSTSATNALSANQGKILNDNINSGWINPNETWTYSSVDNPTGVITISGDKTSKYSLGMRIKFTNNSNVIYGIITKISYSSPNTTLTFLHEINPSTSQALHLMQNSAITNNYYSMVKVPYGFPIANEKWTISTVVNTDQVQTNPVNGTWYNLGGVQLLVPVGSWKISVGSTYAAVRDETNITDNWVKSTLSTANNSQSDFEFTKASYHQLPTTNTITAFGTTYCEKRITLTTPTTYYFNLSTIRNNNSVIRINGSVSPTIIKAVCAYL